MARLNKVGIDYFPFNVNFFDDDKIQLIESEYGAEGGYIAIRLLCKIYREGYYYQWGKDQCLLFTRSIGGGLECGMVTKIIKSLVCREFFSEPLFNTFGILTSRGIQERYFEATKRYKQVCVFREYLLIDTTHYPNVHIKPIHADINSQNACSNPQKKEEKKKEIVIQGKIRVLSESLWGIMEQILSDHSYLETLCINHSIHHQEGLQEYVKLFFITLENQQVFEKNIFEAKQHFARWLKKELETIKVFPGKSRNEKKHPAAILPILKKKTDERF